MKNRKNCIGILLFLFIFCCTQNIRAYAADSEASEDPSPVQKVENLCMVTLTFQDNTANCILLISAKQSATGIHGTLTLYDETDQTLITNWFISAADTSYSGSMSAAVTACHNYTLSFSGQVTNAKGKDEAISASVTKVSPGTSPLEIIENPPVQNSEITENPPVQNSEITENPVDTNTQIFESSDNQTVNTGGITNSSSKPKSASAARPEYAASKNSSFSGTYKTDAGLYLRTGAGQNKTSLCIMGKGDLVYCYGFYTTLDKTDWLYVQYKQNGTLYTGFCSSKYLRKIEISKN